MAVNQGRYRYRDEGFPSSLWPAEMAYFGLAMPEAPQPQQSAPPRMGWIACFRLGSDLVLEFLQKALTALTIVCAGILLCAVFFGGDGKRIAIFQYLAQLSDSWKVLVVALVFVFRHDISTLLARLKILGKDGAQFDRTSNPTYVSVDDSVDTNTRPLTPSPPATSNGGNQQGADHGS